MLLPDGAKLLASNDFCPYAGYQIGAHVLTLQGHPEFSKSYAQALLDTRRELVGEEVFVAATASMQQPTDEQMVATWILKFIDAALDARQRGVAAVERSVANKTTAEVAEEMSDLESTEVAQTAGDEAHSMSEASTTPESVSDAANTPDSTQDAPQSTTYQAYQSRFEDALHEKAEAILDSAPQMASVLRQATDKAARLGPVGRLGALRDDLFTLFDLLRDAIRGDYRAVSRATLLSIVGAILYFLLPLDLVPDFILGLGLLDDAAVLAYVIASVREDIETYRQWCIDRLNLPE